jgi:hypothetical protein
VEQCHWTEAKENIDWVLYKDPGAKEHYRRLRTFERLSAYGAVLAAQAHNGHAQATIRDCKDRAVAYLNNPACEWAIAKQNIDWVFADAGARNTYLSARRLNQSRLEAVLTAQAHDVPAQESVTRCEAEAVAYLEMKIE